MLPQEMTRMQLVQNLTEHLTEVDYDTEEGVLKEFQNH